MNLPMPSRAVLLVNLGSPDSTAVPDVRRYLREFLGDERVIDLKPRWVAKLLVNGIITPTRAPKSAKAYEEIWTDAGSPLVVMSHSKDIEIPDFDWNHNIVNVKRIQASYNSFFN